MDVVNSWTDGLNNALHPLGHLLSGEQAIDIFPALISGAPIEALRSVSAAQIAEMVARVNAWWDGSNIHAEHIRAAIEYTLRDWKDA